MNSAHERRSNRPIAHKTVKPEIRDSNSGFLTRANQFRQAFKPELDIAKQLGREIFRPQLALAQKFPLLRRRVRHTVSPYHEAILNRSARRERKRKAPFPVSCSIDLIVCSKAFKQNSLLSAMFDKLKDNAEVITGATGPRTGQLPFQLVRLELWMKGIGRKQLQRQLQFRSESRVFLNEAPRGANKGLGGKEQAFQVRMRLTICFGVAGRQQPASNSRRADFTAWSRVSRRRSARRRCKTSTSDSCSSTPNSSAESNTCANVFMAVRICLFIRECKRQNHLREPSSEVGGKGDTNRQTPGIELTGSIPFSLYSPHRAGGAPESGWPHGNR